MSTDSGHRSLNEKTGAAKVVVKHILLEIAKGGFKYQFYHLLAV